MLDAVVIFNPAAGRFATDGMISQAVRRLEMNGWRVEIVASQSGEHTTQLALQAAQAGMDALFVAGGDGSVGQAVAGLLGSQTALGVLPAGTSNLWASELGLKGVNFTHRRALEQGAQALAQARVQVVDVGMCNQNPFLMWAGLGLDAIVVKQLESRRQGRRRFALAKYSALILWDAAVWKGLNINLIVDGERVQGEFALAVVSNIRGYAGGLAEISPQACLDDGRMDLWLFSGASLRQTLLHVWRLLSGRHTRSKQVRQFSFNQLSIETEEPLAVQLDGDPIEINRNIEIQVQSSALRVLIPSDTPDGLFKQPAEYLTRR